jgi:hypothetical protein
MLPVKNLKTCTAQGNKIGPTLQNRLDNMHMARKGQLLWPEQGVYINNTHTIKHTVTYVNYAVCMHVVLLTTEIANALLSLPIGHRLQGF